MPSEVKFVARLPTDVRDWLRSYAKQRDRSMNGQLVSMLKAVMMAEKENAPEGESSEALVSVTH